ncbi:GNAT family N-acetyltransferase [Paenibacillus radicis (ex Gao et al. 2016)]|uniref:N-acetyltransferase YjdG n=1 Tax=Paenibacillus radicis (ex Gao et al. 2016) TaxID=1737354 RepID=A0A917LZF3_9BACL|nr:GNAT family N-acetyltransferase [Paenibacillus radicis (ex Gao et al. 2016)]GGG65749.1 putative N-acetyltransferase YjdG [Paenibacillus radicis (ex Gao et al. 2016)]
MKIVTNRLVVQTIELPLLEAAAKRDTQAIEALGFKTNGEWPVTDFHEAIPFFRELLIRNNGTRGFDSWIIVDKDTQEIVGGAGFQGDPDENGIIEIGFATNESRRRKGYCFEAAHALINWALKQEEVQGIVARCKPDNIGSAGVLTKLGFHLDQKDAEYWYWTYAPRTLV